MFESDRRAGSCSRIAVFVLFAEQERKKRFEERYRYVA
jgi:hypothetical protein